MSHETLAIIWFVLIAVLWCGYFVLEGFDFGVGILLPFIGKNEAERRTIVSTLGPVWDGNEVWLVTAGGVTFAAFPTAFVREHKFWPAVGRVDNVYGDRNLVCSCVGMEAYAETKA